MTQLANTGTSLLRRGRREQNASMQQGNEAPDTTNTVQQDALTTTTSTEVVFTPDPTDTNMDTSQEHGVSNADASFLSEVSGRTPRFETSSHRGPTIAGPIPVQTIAGPIPAQATTNDTDLLGILDPSPPRTTQSPETHRLQQSLRQNAHEQLRAGENVDTRRDALVVETVVRDGSDDGQDDFYNECL